MVKKFTTFLTSLKLGILLFVIIALYSIIGTVLPQGIAPEHYLHRYPNFGSLMVFLQFDDVYSSLIFRALVGVFVINLAGCTLNILPGQIRKMKDTYAPAAGKGRENLYQEELNLQDFRNLLKKKRYKVIEKENGHYAVKHKVGYVGSSVTHLGILVIVLGAFFGNMFAVDGHVSLLPGEEMTFQEHDFSIVVDDFYMEFRDDRSIDQYFSEMTVYENGSKVKEEKIWVNKPLKYNGLNLYQSYYGWRSRLEIRDEDGNLLDHRMMEDNQHHFYEPENLRVYLYGFFPDFTMDRMGNPVTRSQMIADPHFALVLYDYDKYVDSYIVQPGHPVEYNGVTVEFIQPTLYTGIVYRQDAGYLYVLIGSLLMLLGITLSFYFYPKYIYVGASAIIPITRQNSWGLTYEVKKMLKNTTKGKEGLE